MPHRWLRIHSLPSSKRYPESDAERQEVLRRHNVVASYMLGENLNCLLFVTRFGNDPHWSEDDSLPVNGPAPVHSMSLDDEHDPLQFFALDVSWRSGAHDELILAAADDLSGPIMFVNAATQSAYAPYDGGADLFFRCAEDVEAARIRFSNWLSHDISGL